MVVNTDQGKGMMKRRMEGRMKRSMKRRMKRRIKRRMKKSFRRSPLEAVIEVDDYTLDIGWVSSALPTEENSKFSTDFLADSIGPMSLLNE